MFLFSTFQIGERADLRGSRTLCRDRAQRCCAPTQKELNLIVAHAGNFRSLVWLSGLIFWFGSPVFAQRRPVLPQIDLPHPYYYREMYLPQLTSGPSSVAWSPDSREVVYSMAGSLWRQKIDSNVAQQLTDGPGYDYQPDWSPDGKNVVYVSYQKDAMELWLLDLASGKSRPLTEGGAVNLEPRWSPDGKRIAYVSTVYNKRFHVFTAEVRDGNLANIARLTRRNDKARCHATTTARTTWRLVRRGRGMARRFCLSRIAGIFTAQADSGE